MKTFSTLLAIAVLSMFSIGCEKPAVPPVGVPGNPTEDNGHAPDAHEGHDHAAADHTAPHGGHLIELGRNHEYHAELVDDHNTETLVVYMMDGDMKPLTINQASVSLVITSGEKTETFELRGSQPGGSSEFRSNDEAMMGLFDAEEAKGKLRATIDGKPFTGTFNHQAHGHDHAEPTASHEGHDH
jgi:hypothetical protein